MSWKILTQPIDLDFLKNHEVKICYPNFDEHLRYIKSSGRALTWCGRTVEKEITSVSPSYVEDELELINKIITEKGFSSAKVKAKYPDTLKGQKVNVRKMF